MFLSFLSLIITSITVMFIPLLITVLNFMLSQFILSQWVSKYRVVQKNGYPVLFWDNFGNLAPILTILSLLQAEIYGA